MGWVSIRMMMMRTPPSSTKSVHLQLINMPASNQEQRNHDQPVFNMETKRKIEFPPLPRRLWVKQRSKLSCEVGEGRGGKLREGVKIHLDFFSVLASQFHSCQRTFVQLSQFYLLASSHWQAGLDSRHLLKHHDPAQTSRCRWQVFQNRRILGPFTVERTFKKKDPR